MALVSILISVLLIISLISLSWGAIGSNDPSVSFSSEWLKSQFKGIPFAFVDVPFVNVDFQLLSE